MVAAETGNSTTTSRRREECGDSVMQQKAYDLRCRDAAGRWEDSEKGGLAQKARAGQGVASELKEALNLQRSFEAPKKL